MTAPLAGPASMRPSAWSGAGTGVLGRATTEPLPLLASAGLDRAVAMVVLFAFGLNHQVHSGITLGFALAALAAPLWVRALRYYSWARGVLVLMLASAVWGYAMSEYAVPVRVVSAANRTSSTTLLLGLAAGIGVVLWARLILPLWKVAGCYGFGMLCEAAFFDSGRYSANPWKFAWCIPLTVFLLGVAARRRSVLLSVVIMLVLGAASAVFDSRSYFATFLLTSLLLCWQLRPRLAGGRASGLWTAGLIGLLAAAIYYLGSTLLVEGYLGQAAQQRSLAQLDASGSLILGGRPELAATLALMRYRPIGFGAGVEPLDQDVLVAKGGMARLNYDPNNGYVEKFMFGGHIELHSILGDMWATWGIAGVLMVAVIAILLIRTIAECVAHRQADGVVIFLACWTFWNLLFSPLYGSFPTLLLGVGLALLRRRPTTLAGTEQVEPDIVEQPVAR